MELNFEEVVRLYNLLGSVRRGEEAKQGTDDACWTFWLKSTN